MATDRSTLLGDPEYVSTVVESSAERLAACLDGAVERWRAGGRPDAGELFREHPELEATKSFALDAIYDEFRFRRAQGEDLSQAQILDRYPRYRSSLTRLFAVHDAVDGAARDASPDTVLSAFRFEPVERLGRGALSEVFLVRNLPLGGRLSVVKLGLRTEEEAELWGRLDHPGIVPALSFHQSPRFATTGVCMPFQGRATLCDLIDARFGQQPAPDVAQLARQIAVINDGAPSPAPRTRSRCYEDLVLRIGGALAEALHYTHAQGVLHLDLKPSNVLLPALETPQLMDFNLAANLANSRAARGGTLPYMAPEQLESLLDGQGEPLGAASDVYSLGAVLFELLVGQPPFALVKNGPLAVVGPEFLELQSAGAPRLQGVCSPSLAGLIEECLRFDPGDRPSSAEEVARRLRGQLSPARVELRALRRHPVLGLALASGAIVLATVVALGIALRPTRETRLLQAAAAALDAGDFVSATELCASGLQATPQSDRLRLWRAEAWIRQGQPEMAQSDYAAVLLRNPRNPAALVGAGYCLSKQRRHERALANYSWLPDGVRQRPWVRNNVAYALAGSNRHREAVDELDIAIAQSPDDPTLRMNRADALLALALQESQSVDPRAWEDAQRAMSSGPPSGGMYLTAALILGNLATPPPNAREEVPRLLQLAIKNGLSYGAVDADPNLQRWLTEADQESLRRLPPGPQERARYDGLLLPPRAL